MHHIVYQSYAVGQPTEEELKLLLQRARATNFGLGITGVLLYGNGCFLQVLEGDKDVVQHVYAKIKADFRHTRVITLADGGIRKRIFSSWTMGFQALSGADFVRLTGYIDPYRSNFLDAHLPALDEDMRQLLKSFVVDDIFRL